MRFIANISNGADTVARVSIDDKACETLSQNALRARAELIRDANRHRSPVLSDAVLEQMAVLYGHAVASQIISRESREITCISRGDVVTSHEGRIAVLTSRRDLIMLVSVQDDAEVAAMDDFVQDLIANA